MATIPAPTSHLSREEWPDADFDLPDDSPLDAPSDKDDDDGEDWDVEFNLGRTGGAKAKLVVSGIASRFEAFIKPATQTINIIRPPIQDVDDDTEDEEGVSTIKAASTIKASTLQPPAPKHYPSTIEEDIEDAFDIPSNLTRLSLAPQALSHRSSKNSLEWGDKDQTSSSQSSDAYSNLGLADVDPASVSTSSASSISLPETETEDEDEDATEGLIIPSAIFDSGYGARQLTMMLEMKKKAQYVCNQVKVANPDPEDDFETGLIFDDDVDLSPSRLLSQHHSKRHFTRCNTVPFSKPQENFAPVRARSEHLKSPTRPPVASIRQLRKLHRSPSPPTILLPTRSQDSQISTAFPSPSTSSFPSKPGSLRGQKSHTGLKSPSPTSTRKLARKASMSCLLESSHAQESKSASSKAARYEEPTASSRARTHKNTASRIYDMKIPPTRPSTPSSNPTALRLTMPTQSRIKSRPALSSVFSSITSTPRATSPIPPRPLSSLAKPPASRVTPPPAPKILRRPKRLRTYGDGTELDGFADLPTDREKEVKYRVQPKGYGNRIPGATYSSVVKAAAGSLRTQTKEPVGAIDPPPNTLRRTTARIGTTMPPPLSEVLPKKSKKSRGARRKPTLIRNLNSANAPKVVGDMRWNPQTHRWEGNDQVLRDFDAAIGTSTRPALITHLTGSSIGSPVGSFTSGARRVGNMIFDPGRMCWVSTLPPEEDEPDVFADLADDEEDSDYWERKAGTIRIKPSISSTANSSLSSSEELPSPLHTHSRTISDSGSDRGSRASLVVCDIDDTFLERCHAAEERHRAEMKGWRSLLSRHTTLGDDDKSYLYDIRALATRKY